jgi:hypothetical protein
MQLEHHKYLKSLHFSLTIGQMTRRQKTLIFNAFLDLEILVLCYRKSVLWLTYGNHKDTPRPTVQETREVMKELQEKITAFLADIDAQIHS